MKALERTGSTLRNGQRLGEGTFNDTSPVSPSSPVREQLLPAPEDGSPQQGGVRRGQRGGSGPCSPVWLSPPGHSCANARQTPGEITERRKADEQRQRAEANAAIAQNRERMRKNSVQKAEASTSTAQQQTKRAEARES